MHEEIKEYVMGHKLKDRVREAYFLADPDELQKVYLTYMEFVTLSGIPPIVWMSLGNLKLALKIWRLRIKAYENKSMNLQNSCRKKFTLIKNCLRKIKN